MYIPTMNEQTIGASTEKPRIIEGQAANALLEGEQTGVAEAREAAETEEAKRKALADARLASLPEEIKGVKERLEDLQKNLNKAKIDAENPGPMQKILKGIVEGIEKDIDDQQALLGELSTERDFYLLQFGNEDTERQ